MTLAHPISVGLFDGFSWIRCEGKGSFANSPAMKTFGEARIAAGDTCLVVDLGACTGMDSTFMGTIAGLAMRLSAVPGGVLQIAEAGERNRRSLEDLGLDFLIEIDPPATVWSGRLDDIRGQLKPPQAPGTMGHIQRARLILEAHQTLSGVNDKNAHTFEEVVNLMGKELAEKEKLAKEGGTP